MNNALKKEKEKKAGNPFFILIIFIVLFAFLYFVPDIYKKYNSTVTNFFGKGESANANDTLKDDEGKNPASAYYQIGSNGTLNFNELLLDSISLSEDNKILTLTINVEGTFDLDEANYYLEFYQNRKTFIGRRVLTGKVTKSKTFSIDVSNLNIDTTTYFIVSHISDRVIPSLDAPSDESGLSSMSCTKENENYEYIFYHKKLTKVKYKYTFFNNIGLDAYANELFKYKSLSRDYDELNGVKSSVIEDTVSFIFLTEFDYGEVASFSRINDKYIFQKDVLNNLVDFKMEARGFDCE